MKAITTIFESILSNGDTLIWTPADGPTEMAASSARGWQWGGLEATSHRGWQWGG
jgi:hypothetical protein